MAEVQALHSVTASETVGVGQFLVSAGPSTGPSTYAPLTVSIAYYNAQVASGSGSLSFQLFYSYDRGQSWHGGASGASVTLSSTPAYGGQVITDAPSQATSTGSVWLQMVATLSGTNAAVAYRADTV